MAVGILIPAAAFLLFNKRTLTVPVSNSFRICAITSLFPWSDEEGCVIDISSWIAMRGFSKRLKIRNRPVGLSLRIFRRASFFLGSVGVCVKGVLDSFDNSVNSLGW